MPPTASNRLPRRTQPAQDKWGLFDPELAGVAATIRILSTQSESEAVPQAPIEASPSENDDGALYAVESALRCPQCQKEIRTFRALRVLQTHVSFMSTLPRKGYVLVCPECAGLLSAELSGLI